MAADHNSTQVMFLILHFFETQKKNIFVCANTVQNLYFPLLKIISIYQKISSIIIHNISAKTIALYFCDIMMKYFAI